MSTCAICLGSGKLVHAINTSTSRGWSASLCECRSFLPPRQGSASWWTLRSVLSETVVPLIPTDTAFEVKVTTEVPISAENYVVQMRGNRYYPTNVDLNDTTLTPDQARELAAALLRAADAADEIDKADVDVCGHWAPCDCPASTEAPR